MKIKRNLIILAITFTGVTIFTVLNKDRFIVQNSQGVQLPETIFDATTTVPGTRLVFSYPSKGFYGLGAEVVTDETEHSFGLGPVSSYVAEKGSQFVIFRIGVHDLPAEKASLEDFVQSINPDSFLGQYVKTDGTYKEINGLKFFLVKVAEDAIIWHAWTLVDKDIITITLAYTGSEGVESEAASVNNDQLFMQILETIHVQ